MSTEVHIYVGNLQEGNEEECPFAERIVRKGTVPIDLFLFGLLPIVAVIVGAILIARQRGDSQSDVRHHGHL
jgi:hypothetical protein